MIALASDHIGAERTISSGLVASDADRLGQVAVGGRTSGLIGLGEEVTWRARHFGVTQHLTSKITAFDPGPEWTKCPEPETSAPPPPPPPPEPATNQSATQPD